MIAIKCNSVCPLVCSSTRITMGCLAIWSFRRVILTVENSRRRYLTGRLQKKNAKPDNLLAARSYTKPIAVYFCFFNAKLRSGDDVAITLNSCAFQRWFKFCWSTDMSWLLISVWSEEQVSKQSPRNSYQSQTTTTGCQRKRQGTKGQRKRQYTKRSIRQHVIIYWSLRLKVYSRTG